MQKKGEGVLREREKGGGRERERNQGRAHSVMYVCGSD